MATKSPVPAFLLASTVYLRINTEARRGMVTGHVFRPGGVIQYLITWDEPAEEQEHWACELTDEKAYLGSGSAAEPAEGSA